MVMVCMCNFMLRCFVYYYHFYDMHTDAIHRHTSAPTGTHVHVKRAQSTLTNMDELFAYVVRHNYIYA